MKSLTSLKFLLPILVLVSVSTSISAQAEQKPDSVSIAGRWDVTLYRDGKTYPSWLQVMHSGHNTWVGEWVAIVGSARPVSKINYSGGKISFSMPPQWEEGAGDLKVEGRVEGDSLVGTIIYPDGSNYTWTGVRAPVLRATKPLVWGKTIRLFNGYNLKGWHATGENQWIARNGILSSPGSGANLVTDQKFKDFKLHIEFRYPKGSNSGVYLRGRYELQIMDSGKEPSPVELGSVYGFISPSEQVAKKPGEWQSYDITLVGRMLTVVANGKTIICNQEIPGITGGALDSKEEAPGPILLQGDHGPIEYKNILITPAR